METATKGIIGVQVMHRRAIAMLLLACIAMLALAPQATWARTDKITSSTALVLKTPTAPIPEAALLDVGIPTLNDGLYLTDDEDTVFPEVRFAEAIYFSNQLAKVMEKSGPEAV